MKIMNPTPKAFRTPQYEGWWNNEITHHTYEFGWWEDDITRFIDQWLEELGYLGLPPLPGTELDARDKHIKWCLEKKNQHRAFMFKVLGRPNSEEEAETAVKAHKFYEYEPITTT